ncbi:MAG: hypothetical protein SFW67_29590 [Myxococcaceae bacterium]|nr:hypothetical protein [Myxococcaceae bacterium]
MKWLPLAALAVLPSACPDIRRPASEGVVVAGSASWGGFDRRAEPLADVTVTLSAGTASTSAVSGETGDWRVELPPQPVAPTTLTAWRTGFAPWGRTLLAGERTELQSSFALEPLAPMDCVDTGCTTGGGELRWVDAPSGASAAAAWLEPLDAPALTTADALLAAVAVELDGGTLPGTLLVRVPIASWADVVDAMPGTGAIEVPVAVLGPTDRAWRPAGTGTLRTEAGSVIAEGQLARVRSGLFSPGVVAAVSPLARGLVGVFGGPARVGCVEGTVSIDDAVSPGVTLVPAVGTASASDGTGAVCVEVPLGDAPQAARVQYAGVIFTSATIPAATTPARCSQGCRALGRLPVRGTSVATVAPCQVAVRVVDEVGQPLPGAVVVGMDDGITQASFTSICGRLGTRCTLTGATDGDGGVRLVVPVQASLRLSARATTATGQRLGRLLEPVCPREPVTLRAGSGHEGQELTVSIQGQQVSWSPTLPSHRIQVERDGGIAWAVRSFIGVAGPIVSGTPPVGAEVEVPGDGSLRAGDVVIVSVDSARASGVVVRGTAAARVE